MRGLMWHNLLRCGHMRCGAVRLEARSWKTVVNNKNTRRVRKGKTRAAVADDAHEVVVEAGIRLDSGESKNLALQRRLSCSKTQVGPMLQLCTGFMSNAWSTLLTEEKNNTSMSYQSKRCRLRIAQMCTHWFADHLQ